MTVDSEDVISIGDDLLERHPSRFGSDFEENKREVQRLTEMRSRYVRNRIAGYVTRRYAEEQSP